MIVIADAGPLLHLFWVDALTWALPPPPIMVVEAVWQEVDLHAPEVLADSRLRRVALPAPVPPALVGRALDGGEEAALAYALAQSPDTDLLVLCDELHARQVCRDLSLAVTGSVGLIVTACAEGRVSREVAEAALLDLRERGRFHVKRTLITQAIAALDAAEEDNA